VVVIKNACFYSATLSGIQPSVYLYNLGANPVHLAKDILSLPITLPLTLSLTHIKYNWSGGCSPLILPSESTRFLAIADFGYGGQAPGI